MKETNKRLFALTLAFVMAFSTLSVGSISSQAMESREENPSEETDSAQTELSEDDFTLEVDGDPSLEPNVELTIVPSLDQVPEEPTEVSGDPVEETPAEAPENPEENVQTETPENPEEDVSTKAPENPEETPAEAPENPEEKMPETPENPEEETPEETPAETEPETISLTAQIVWENDEESARPEAVSLWLYTDEEKAEEPVVVTAEDEWTYIWEDLPVCHEDGSEFVYVIDTDEVPDGYERVETDEESAETDAADESVELEESTEEDKTVWTVTYRYTKEPELEQAAEAPALMKAGAAAENSIAPLSEEDETGYVEKKVRIVKQWYNDEEADRPDFIPVYMYLQGEFYKTITLSRNNGWMWVEKLQIPEDAAMDCVIVEGDYAGKENYETVANSYAYISAQSNEVLYDLDITSGKITEDVRTELYFNLHVGHVADRITDDTSFMVDLYCDGELYDTLIFTDEKSQKKLIESNADGAEYHYGYGEYSNYDWICIIENLPIFSEDGRKMEYEFRSQQSDLLQAQTIKVNPQLVTATNMGMTDYASMYANPEYTGINYTSWSKSVDLNVFWKDVNHAERPEYQHFTLYADGKEIYKISRSASGEITTEKGADFEKFSMEYTLSFDWDSYETGAWWRLPAFNLETKQEISYTIKADSLEGYQIVAEEGNNQHFTFTNQLLAETASPTVNIQWSGDSNSVRPKSITVTLTADRDPVGDAVTLNEQNNWSYTWESVPSVREDGKAVSFDVIQENLPEGYIVTKDRDGADFTITNRYEKNTVRVYWIDQTGSENLAMFQPESVPIYFYDKDGKKVDQANVTGNPDSWVWSGEFADSDVAEVVVEESALQGGMMTTNGNNCVYLKFESRVVLNDNGDVSVYIYLIKETEYQFGQRSLLVNIEAKLKGLASGSSVSAVLYGDGEQKASCSASWNASLSEWYVRFYNNPKLNQDGSEIIYTVVFKDNTTGKEYKLSDYTESQTDDDLRLSDRNDWYWHSTYLFEGIAVTSDKTTIELKFEGYTDLAGEIIPITVYKGQEKYADVSFNVGKSSEAKIFYEDSDEPESVPVVVGSPGSSSSNSIWWNGAYGRVSFSFSIDLPEDSTDIFSIKVGEFKGKDRMSETYRSATSIYYNESLYDSLEQEGVLKIKKVWSDKSNAANARPETVKYDIYTYTDGEMELVRTIELTGDSAGNTWTMETSIPIKDEEGNLISYYIHEHMVENYYRNVQSDMYHNNMDYNYMNFDSGSLTYEYFSSSVYMPNLDKVRIYVQVKRPGEDIWNNKIWYGENDFPSCIAGVFPGVSVTIMRDGEEFLRIDNISDTSSRIVQGADGESYSWGYEYKNSYASFWIDSLPMKDETGRAYRYDVKYSGQTDLAQDMIVTATSGYYYGNSLTYNYNISYPLQFFDLVIGSKVWEDNDDAAGVRPDYLMVNLYANGELLDTAVMKCETGLDFYKGTRISMPEEIRESMWDILRYIQGEQLYWSRLPYYDNDGNRIEYKVEVVDPLGNYTGTVASLEKAVMTRTNMMSATNMTQTNQIVMKYNPSSTDTTSVTVKKVWEDENDALEARPESIQVQLLADRYVAGTQTLSEENGWTYTWENLKVTESGRTLTYTVREVNVPGYYKCTTEVLDDGTIQLTNTLDTHDPMLSGGEDDPNKPDVPDDPDNPTKPDDPTKPGTSGDSDDPGDPTKPGDSDTPGDSGSSDPSGGSSGHHGGSGSSDSQGAANTAVSGNSSGVAIPQTGDGQPIGILILLAGMSAAGIAAMYVRRRRKEE